MLGILQQLLLIRESPILVVMLIQGSIIDGGLAYAKNGIVALLFSRMALPQITSVLHPQQWSGTLAEQAHAACLGVAWNPDP